MPDRPALSHVISELLETESAYHEALAEAITYRQMLYVTLDQLAKAVGRLRGAEQRIRQLSGMEPWHDLTGE